MKQDYESFQRQTRTILITMLLSLIVPVVTLWLVLDATDPFGVTAYAEWLHWTQSERMYHESGFIHPTGAYEIGGHSLTIGDDGLRIVPDSDSADCTIALIGDSVTFGLGVSDSDTFANVLALEYPDIEFINAGRQGYDGSNLSRAVESIDADYYVYLMVGNDAQPATGIYPVPDIPNALSLHMTWLYRVMTSQPGADNDLQEFDAMLQVMADAEVLVFAYNAPELAHIANAYINSHLVTIGADYHISVVDPHPDASGHRAIADIISPYLQNIC